MQPLAWERETRKISFISTRYESEIFSFEIKYLALAFLQTETNIKTRTLFLNGDINKFYVKNFKY